MTNDSKSEESIKSAEPGARTHQFTSSIEAGPDRKEAVERALDELARQAQELRMGYE